MKGFIFLELLCYDWAVLHWNPCVTATKEKNLEISNGVQIMKEKIAKVCPEK